MEYRIMEGHFVKFFQIERDHHVGYMLERFVTS